MMMAVADRSVGYAGSVGTADWAVMNSYGRTGRWCVLGADDLAVSQGTGDRALRVSAGRAPGDGVLDQWDAVVDLAGAPVSSGSRWDTVVLRRDWDADETSVQILQGGTSRALAPTITDDPGYSRADQPIALARFAAGQTAVQEIVDLRTWAGDGGGLIAVSTDVLSFLDAVGTQIVIGGVTFTRVMVGGSPSWHRAGGLPAPQTTGPAGDWVDLNRSDFLNLPDPVRVTVTLPAAAHVALSWSGIVGVGGGPSGGSLELAPRVSGGVLNPTAFLNTARSAGLNSPESISRNRTILLPAGTSTIDLQARTTGTSHGPGNGARLRGAYLEAVPLRWAN